MLNYYKFKDITKNPLLQENHLAEFCPLFQEIPLLQDTLLRESTVLLQARILYFQFYRSNYRSLWKYILYPVLNITYVRAMYLKCSTAIPIN